MLRKINNYKSVEKNLLIGLDRKPTLKEIAWEMNVEIEEARKIKKAMFRICSSETPVSGKSGKFDKSLHDFIVDERAPSSFETSDELTRKKILTKNLRYLTKEEQEVLVMRYGLEDSDEFTLKEIGEKLGCTKEWIRQIQMTSIRKLRGIPQIAALK